ncbi:MAG: PilW family protein [Patescibacteria group bacterium]
MEVRKKVKSEARSGFTLLEVLVSIGIIAILGILVTQTFIATTRTNTKAELLKDIKENGDFALGVMVRMIQNAADITSSCATGGTTTDNISILNSDGGTTTFACRLDGSVMRIASVSAGVPAYLTSSNLTLGSAACDTNALSFVCTTLSDNTRSVKINFSLAQKGAPVFQFEKMSVSFQTSAVVRNFE